MPVEGAAVMTDEQTAELSAHLAEGGRPRRRRAVKWEVRTL